MHKELNLNLRAREVADLDPYNIRSKPVVNSAKELLGEDENKNRGVAAETEWPGIIEREKAEWKKVLGRDEGLQVSPWRQDFCRSRNRI